MKRLDNETKMIITCIIGIVGMFAIGFVGMGEKYKLNKIINEKNELIESQAKMLTEKNNNCYCGFYEDFYYKYSSETYE